MKHLPMQERITVRRVRNGRGQPGGGRISASHNVGIHLGRNTTISETFQNTSGKVMRS